MPALIVEKHLLNELFSERGGGMDLISLKILNILKKERNFFDLQLNIYMLRYFKIYVPTKNQT